MSNDVVRELSSGFLISSQAFARESALKQTELLSGAKGKPVVFVENFNKLTDGAALKNKLINGEDISLEVEFNGITITEAQKKALEVIRPLLDSISAIKPAYKWVIPTEDQRRAIGGARFSATRVVSASGYAASKSALKKLWDLASEYWSGGKKPKSYSGTFDGYNRAVIFTDHNTISVGCHTVTRAELEAVAKHYEWEPNVTKA